jgi:hypothetical protein
VDVTRWFNETFALYREGQDFFYSSIPVSYQLSITPTTTVQLRLEVTDYSSPVGITVNGYIDNTAANEYFLFDGEMSIDGDTPFTQLTTIVSDLSNAVGKLRVTPMDSQGKPINALRWQVDSFRGLLERSYKVFTKNPMGELVSADGRLVCGSTVSVGVGDLVTDSLSYMYRVAKVQDAWRGPSYEVNHKELILVKVDS